MLLRPHHLLCIRFYRGYGYSETFNRNMRETIARLQTGESFSVTNEADDLCRACPNLQNGVCKTEEKVRRYDRKTASLMDLVPGFTYTLPEITRIADETVFTPGRFSEICADCEWSGICNAALSQAEQTKTTN